MMLHMGLSSGHWALSVHSHTLLTHCWVKTRPPEPGWVLEWQAVLQPPLHWQQRLQVSVRKPTCLALPAVHTTDILIC